MGLTLQGRQVADEVSSQRQLFQRCHVLQTGYVDGLNQVAVEIEISQSCAQKIHRRNLKRRELFFCHKAQVRQQSCVSHLASVCFKFMNCKCRLRNCQLCFDQTLVREFPWRLSLCSWLSPARCSWETTVRELRPKSIFVNVNFTVAGRSGKALKNINVVNIFEMLDVLHQVSSFLSRCAFRAEIRTCVLFPELNPVEMVSQSQTWCCCYRLLIHEEKWSDANWWLEHSGSSQLKQWHEHETVCVSLA